VTDTAVEFSKANPIWGTGRRKSAIARVRLMPGNGKILINKREVNDALTSYDIGVNVRGGGPTGQADATKLGIARALRKADPSLEQALRDGKFLTRDPRMVERKKYGQKGARKRFQFSKR